MAFKFSKALLAGGLAALAGVAFAFPLWLDGPVNRSNPHDPSSPYHPTQTPWVVIGSPTFSPTVSPTPTQSRTFTASPTPSVTPTSTLTPLVYYEGEASAMHWDGVNRTIFALTPTSGAPNYVTATETSAGGTHTGMGFYLQLYMGSWDVPVVAGVGNTPGAFVTVAPYSTLSLWLRSYSGCFDPMVMIHSPGSITGNSSAWVTATAYTTDGGPFDAGVWKHVLIPLSAFNGTNFWGANYNLASQGYQIDAVAVLPSYPWAWAKENSFGSCGPSGTYLGFPYNAVQCNADALNLDDVWFSADPVPGPAQKVYAPTFDAFVNLGGTTEWNTQWSVSSDSLSCASPSTTLSFPPPGQAPVDIASSPYSTCLVGHLAGTYGAANGSGSGTCNNTQYSYVLMSANFAPSGSPVDLTLLPGLPLTGGQVTGLSWVMKLGPTSGAVDYKVTITKAGINAVNQGANYYHLVSNAQLSANGGVWQNFKINFPPVGSLGTDPVNSFGQPSWAAGAGASMAWNTSDVVSLQVAPADTARGQNFDIYVDHFVFY